MEEIIDPKLQLWLLHFLPTVLILQFNKLVLELNPQLSFIIKIIFELFFRLPEFLSFVIQHEFKLAQVVIFVRGNIYILVCLLLFEWP